MKTTLTDIATIPELFAWRVAQTPQGLAYRQFDADAGAWRDFSWQQIGASVALWQRAIGTLGLAHGARVAILLPNCVDAVCADQAALALGLVPVPMHALDNPASISYIIQDSAAELLVLASGEQWRAIAAVGDALPALRLVVSAAAPPAASTTNASAAAPAAPTLTDMQTWLASAPSAAPAHEAVLRGDLAAIVYTSGTTGKPKGVMLSHHNILANIKAVLTRVPAGADDVFLSFLPLSHTFERTIGYYLPMAAGACVAYARSVALLAEDFKIVRPTVLVSVPRIYERFYAKLQEKLAQSSALQRAVFGLAQRVGWRRFCRRQKLAAGAGLPLFDALIWPVLERLVAREVLAQFGGRIRAAVTGGAPMSQAVAECFLGLGLPLLQGYGMTETSPVVSANGVDDNWPTTVGCPIDGVEVRIGERGELQVRAASVMQGYLNRTEDSAAALTADGWLRTGDQAVIEQGHIRIVGRIKEIMVTSTGEKIAPVDVEQAVLADPLFDQVMAVGENRPFISVIAVLNPGVWAELAAQLQLDPAVAANLNLPATQAALLKRLQEATRALPRYAMPRAVWVSDYPWTVENSLMTPTLKLKRNALHARFNNEIEAIYTRYAVR